MSIEIDTPTLITGKSGRHFTYVFRGLTAGLIVSILVSAVIWFMSAAIPAKTGGPSTILQSFCQWLYDSQIGTGIRESIWVFPIIEGIHLLGIALSVGALCWFDFRLVGVALRDTPVSVVWKQVMPVALSGFVLMIVSGSFLFWAEAATAYHSVHFWIKLTLLFLAGVNAWVFEFKTHAGIAAWDTAAVPPLPARIAGFLSLVLWTGIIITGRTMAYNF